MIKVGANIDYRDHAVEGGLRAAILLPQFFLPLGRCGAILFDLMQGDFGIHGAGITQKQCAIAKTADL